MKNRHPWERNAEEFDKLFEAIYPHKETIKNLLSQYTDAAALSSLAAGFIKTGPSDIEKLTDSINKLRASFDSYLKTTGQGEEPKIGGTD